MVRAGGVEELAEDEGLVFISYIEGRWYRLSLLGGPIDAFTELVSLIGAALFVMAGAFFLLGGGGVMDTSTRRAPRRRRN